MSQQSLKSFVWNVEAPREGLLYTLFSKPWHYHCPQHCVWAAPFERVAAVEQRRPECGSCLPIYLRIRKPVSNARNATTLNTTEQHLKLLSNTYHYRPTLNTTEQHLTLLSNIQHYGPKLNTTVQHLTLLPNTSQHRSTLVNSTGYTNYLIYQQHFCPPLPTCTCYLTNQPTKWPSCYWTNQSKLTEPKIYFLLVVYRRESTKISEYCQNMLYIRCLLNNVKETVLKGKLGYWVINSLN